MGGILIRSTFIIILMTLFFGGWICEEAGGSEGDPFDLWNEEINEEILVNLSDEKPLELDGRYQLVVMSVDIDGNKVYSELYKDGQMVHSKINVLANEVDDTFVYSRPGTEQEIRVHFKNSLRGADQNLATIDRLWQTSEENPDLILINSTQSRTIFSGMLLVLEEGYELAVQSVDIDGNKVYLDLYKDGMVVDSRVIIPANGVDGSFIYSSPGTPQEIRVHFKNAFRGADRNLATIDSLRQTSEFNPGQILINSTQSHTMVSGTPLILEEGWELEIQSIDINGNKVYLELFKDGRWIDSQVIIPANEFNHTFIYSRPGTSQEIRARFKNAFRGADQNLATVNDLQQTSEENPGQILIDDSRSRTVTSGTPIVLEEGYELAIKSVDIDGNKVYLELEKEGEVVDSQLIMPANDVDDIFTYFSPGTPLEIKVHFKNAFRGADQNLATVDGLWQTSEAYPDQTLINDSRSRIFASGTPIKLEEGYELAIQSIDIDGNKVYLELYKDGILIDSQVVIAAKEVDDTFIYSRPGTSQEIRVHFKNAFRGADQSLATVDDIRQTSEVNPGQILTADSRSQTVTSGTPLRLEEGYELRIQSIDIDGNKVYLELEKDGGVVDSQVIRSENEVDDTFIYARPETSQEIKVHFKNAFRGAEQNLATIDSIWQ